MGNGEWGLGTGDWGQRGQGRIFYQCPMPNAQCPIPDFQQMDG
ncbi:hypothetical protein [Nostoc sp. CMAA1605]|nr:hypothetical protein [Nostoc sp. CMAA1605]